MIISGVRMVDSDDTPMIIPSSHPPTQTMATQNSFDLYSPSYMLLSRFRK